MENEEIQALVGVSGRMKPLLWQLPCDRGSRKAPLHRDQQRLQAIEIFQRLLQCCLVHLLLLLLLWLLAVRAARVGSRIQPVRIQPLASKMHPPSSRT